MDPSKLISVVVPVYNQESNLYRSIPDLINQSYSNIEIIVINDGSTDRSPEIIKEYAVKDARIRYVDKENGGLVSAVITGIKKSVGDYIAFVDPDDRVKENFIEVLASNIGDFDILCGGFITRTENRYIPYFLSGGCYIGEAQLQALRKRFLFDIKSLGISNEIFISRWNKLYKRSVLINSLQDIEKNVGISLGEDTVFTYIVLGKVTSLSVVKSPCGYIYDMSSPTSMMSADQIETHITKSKNAYMALHGLMVSNSDLLLANELYYLLVDSLYQRLLRSSSGTDFSHLVDFLSHDELYLQSIRDISTSCSYVNRVLLNLKLFISNKSVIRCIQKIFSIINKAL